MRSATSPATTLPCSAATIIPLIAAALGGGIATPLVMAGAALAFIASAAAIPAP